MRSLAMLLFLGLGVAIGLGLSVSRKGDGRDPAASPTSEPTDELDVAAAERNDALSSDEPLAGTQPTEPSPTATSDDSAEALPAVAKESATAADSALRVRGADLPSDGHEVSEASVVDHPANPPDDLPDLATVLAQFPERQYEKGDGVITGVVVDRDDAPIEGVEVTAVIWGATPGPKPRNVLDTTVLEYVRQEIDQYHYDRAMMSRAMTEADGSFVVEGIRTDGSYRLAFEKEGWFFFGQNLRRVSAGQERKARGLPTARVRVEVVGPPHLVARGGNVYLAEGIWEGSLQGESEAFRWSPQFPVIEMPAVGFAQFRFGVLWSDVGEIRYHRADEMSSEAPDRDDNAVDGTVRLVLPNFSTVHGQLYFAPGEPERTNDVTVRLQPVSPQTRPDSSTTNQPRWATLARGARAYAFDLVRPGRYAVTLIAGGNEIETLEVDVHEPRVAVDFEVPALVRERFIYVRVQNQNGQPIRGARFTQVNEDGRNAFFGGQLENYLDDDGVYWVEFYAENNFGLPPERFVRIDTPRYGSQRLEVTRTGVSLTATFVEPAIVDVDLSTLVDVRLRAFVKLKVDGSKVSVGVREQDSIRLGPIAPGPIDLVMVLESDIAPERDLGRLSITARSGRQRVVFPAPRLFHIRVVIPEECRRGKLALRSKSSTDFYNDPKSLLGARELLFPWNPPGEYVLIFTQESGAIEIPLVVNSDQRVVLDSTRLQQPRSR